MSSMFSTPSAASTFPSGMLSNTMGHSFHTGAFSDHSEDEIVWSRSDNGGASPSSYSSLSDSYITASSRGGDFVVLSYPPSPRMHARSPSLLTPVENQMGSVKGPQLYTPITASRNNSLSAQMAAMSLSVNTGVATKAAKKKAKKEKTDGAQKGKNVDRKKQAGKAKKAKSKAVDNPATPVQAYPSPAPSPTTANTKKISSKPKSPTSGKTKHTGKSPATGLGSRPIVDDISDRLSVISQDNESVGTPTLYDEASTFISRFLSNPDAKKDRICRLTLLQSLIIELGLSSSNLPASLTSARATLKSRAFINVREYIAVRAQGPEAIQKAMHPTRNALVKNIRQNKKNRAPLSWVKEMGLQVLLVDATH